VRSAVVVPSLAGAVTATDERVTVIGPEKLAALVVRAGVVDWLIRKVS
jgi:hypothetical protein